MKKSILIISTLISALIIVLITLNFTTMNHIKTEVLIDAQKEKVWQTLIEVHNYKNWNPFIVSSEGTPKIGNQLSNTMMNKGSAIVFYPIITKLIPFQEFEWLGSGLAGMFKGRHYFILEEQENGQTKVIHGEQFSGLLSGLILKFIGEDTLQNFHKMNNAIKTEVEKTTS